MESDDISQTAKRIRRGLYLSREQQGTLLAIADNVRPGSREVDLLFDIIDDLLLRLGAQLS